MAQFPNKVNLLTVDDDKFDPAARSAAFPAWATTKSVLSRGGKVSEKPDAETGSLERPAFSDIIWPKRPCVGWPCTSSPLFVMPRDFHRNVKRENPIFFEGITPRLLFTLILLEEPPYVNVATSAMLNRNFPPPNAARLERLAPIDIAIHLVKRFREHPSECCGRRIYCCA